MSNTYRHNDRKPVLRAGAAVLRTVLQICAAADMDGRELMRELDYEKVGMRIRQVRKVKGLSQNDLAKKCGISMSFLGHIERGTRIMSMETFVNICKALNTGADELLWGAACPSDTVLDMWNLPDKEKNKKKPQGNTADRADGRKPDSYAMYVRIMKSVAEIMNGM